ncbi:MAG: hypothetical protein RTV31_06410 [Candidatus Thorarchaeota archaeon]
MALDKQLAEILRIGGFITGEKHESRLMSILGVILRLQQDPPIPLTFADIYEQLEKDEPSSKLTKAWIHRVLKMLIESKLVRVDNPTAHRKKYIADVNTIMAGFEQIKSKKIEELETKNDAIKKELAVVKALDCGHLSKEFVRSVTGRQEEVSSRIVRGVEELHRVLRFNMLDNAGEGDIIRATLLWIGPFVDDAMASRMMRFMEAAERGAEIRYLVSTDVFNLEESAKLRSVLEGMSGIAQLIAEMETRGKKFGVRMYSGLKTYNQVSFNGESMALIIAENPVTATWITRQFNPDLIDNAVKTFDKDWKKAKSIGNLTPEDFDAFGAPPEGLIRKVVSGDIEEK